MSEDRPPRALAAFFAIATRFPRSTRRLRRAIAALALAASPALRDALAANARRLGRSDATAFARAVVASFVDFVVDVVEIDGRPADAIRDRVATVHGHDRYRALRRPERGVIFVTAHLGSFEVGLSALRGVEESVHVVFKRDPFPTFERARAALRHALGVREIALDDGWDALMRMRGALEAGEVIVMQADRAMPGQRWQRVPFGDGHLDLPAGPATLARMTGAAIVPVFCVRRADGRFDVHLDEPIDTSGGDEAAIAAIGRAIERKVLAFAEQWLVLHAAFAEDRARVGSRPPATT